MVMIGQVSLIAYRVTWERQAIKEEKAESAVSLTQIDDLTFSAKVKFIGFHE